MSGLELVLRNLAAWSAQAGVLGLAAAGLARLLPIERPAARLGFLQALLVAVLFLPLVVPWAPVAAAVSWSLERTAAAPPAVGAPPPAIAPLSAASDWPAVIAALLLVGASFRLARLGVGLLRLRSFRRRSQPLDPPAWLRALRDEVAPHATLLLCREVDAPAAFGLRRPVVLLPRGFPSLPRDRQEAIALHELVHAARADWLFILLEELVKVALFFHPAIHWLVARIRLAREQAVDERVVRRLGARESYLDALVEAARFAARARAVPAAPFLRESHLRERVDLLLREVHMSRSRALAHVVLTAAALLVAASWAASTVPLLSAEPAALAAVQEPVRAATEPRIVHKVQPSYPADAKSEKVQGLFIIEVVIGKDGIVKDARVVASAPTAERLKQLNPMKGTKAAIEGDSRLAEAALEAVRQWRYEPVLIEGQPADVKALVTVNFKLA